MIWTKQQIATIRGLQAQELISDLQLREAFIPELLLLHVIKKLKHDFISAAHAYGVEVDGLDLEISRQPRIEVHSELIRVQWRPSTLSVELHGGPADGRVMTVENIRQPLLVAVQKPRKLLMRPKFVSDVYVGYTTAPYLLDGWSEQTRRWVFRPAALIEKRDTP